jgi:hypothetical protein
MKSTAYAMARDANGNTVLLIKKGRARARSIQTNGNLPRTHRDGIGEWTNAEVAAYRTGPFGLTPVNLASVGLGTGLGYSNRNGVWDKQGNRISPAAR